MGGIVGNNVSASFSGSPDRVHTVIAGLGGRSITRASLRRVFEQALADSLEPLTFLDLDHALVERVLDRERVQRRSGADCGRHPQGHRRRRREDRMRHNA
jgi:pyruvate ferredoxin oxidoreductase alpha subunit